MDQYWKEILIAFIGLGVAGLAIKIFIGSKKTVKSIASTTNQQGLTAGGDIAGRDILKTASKGEKAK